jgi:hypothetical protein
MEPVNTSHRCIIIVQDFGCLSKQLSSNLSKESRFLMSIRQAVEKLEAPNIQIEGLSIWVHGREFPEETDYWDGNWLRVTVECSSNGAEVSVSGPIIHLSELAAWTDAAEKLHKTLHGEANLDCIEPELSVELVIDKLGSISMTVNITPDHLLQEHCFRFKIDQSYLPELIRSCRTVLASYPIRSAIEKE